MKDASGATITESGTSPLVQRVVREAKAERRKAARRVLSGSFRRARVMRVLLLLAVDGLSLTLAGSIAYLVWARPVHHQAASIYIDLAALLPFFFLGYAKDELYPGFGIGAVQTLRRILLRTSFVFLVVAAASFAFKLPHVYSRMTFAIAWMLSLLLVPVGRILFLKMAHHWSWWGEPSVVVGTGPVAKTAIRALDRALSIGYRPVAVLELEGCSGLADVEGVPVWGDLSRVPEIGRQGVRIALLIEDRSPLQGQELSLLNEHFRHVIHVRGSEAMPVEGVMVRNLGGVLGIEFNNQLLRRRNRLLKRLVDIFLGGASLLATLPILLLAALTVKLTSKGPAFFTQDREGLEGETIGVIKLRTMYVDAEERLERHLASDPAARAEWESRFKLARDPRILPVVGRLLRRFSLDELPQLWQVLRGEMSLVGPRPFPPYHLAGFDEEFRRLRRRVRPGLTEQEMYDTYYIRNWSIWIDLYILARTFGTVVFGRGAY
jgi:Undecaprenyl-phosphate galactose phosphotransferase WbaP